MLTFAGVRIRACVADVESQWLGQRAVILKNLLNHVVLHRVMACSVSSDHIIPYNIATLNIFWVMQFEYLHAVRYHNTSDSSSLLQSFYSSITKHISSSIVSSSLTPSDEISYVMSHLYVYVLVAVIQGGDRYGDKR